MRRLVVAFILVHVVAIFCFAIPIDALGMPSVRALLSPYLRSIGLNESWDTFAPNPQASEQFLKAVVRTTRGHTVVYSFPRMEGLSFIERYQKERYRKFVESVLCSNCSGLWPDIEREVARRTAKDLGPPDAVFLIKFESPIDPAKKLGGADNAAKPTIFSELSIQQQDLQ